MVFKDTKNVLQAEITNNIQRKIQVDITFSFYNTKF